MKHYRLIEYDYPNTPRGLQWLERTLELSIDGRLAPTGFAITACEVSEDAIPVELQGLIELASTTPWEPQPRHNPMNSRARQWGDPVCCACGKPCAECATVTTNMVTE